MCNNDALQVNKTKDEERRKKKETKPREEYKEPCLPFFLFKKGQRKKEKPTKEVNKYKPKHVLHPISINYIVYMCMFGNFYIIDSRAQNLLWRKFIINCFGILGLNLLKKSKHANGVANERNIFYYKAPYFY